MFNLCDELLGSMVSTQFYRRGAVDADKINATKTFVWLYNIAWIYNNDSFCRYRPNDDN